MSTAAGGGVFSTGEISKVIIGTNRKENTAVMAPI